jgi:fused signal recognition particle receptor
MLSKLAKGLAKTRVHVVDRLRDLLPRGRRLSGEDREALEEILISSDAGVELSLEIAESLEEAWRGSGGEADVRTLLARELDRLFEDDETWSWSPAGRPHVILVVGVNGSGKTTSIAKLARYHLDQGRRVLLAACDTFRAAAIEQLVEWGERLGVEVVRHRSGSDPAAVAFDAVEAARARGADVVLVDTGGRLHTHASLMEELRKIHRTLGRILPGAPHDAYLVLDANTGQNGLRQAREFTRACPLTGIVLAKLDSTARGGIVLAIRRELGIPVRFVGTGESPEDLEVFSGREFVRALAGPLD